MDDFYDPKRPELNCRSIEAACVHDSEEYYIDPSSCQLSASRWGLKQVTTWGIAASLLLIAGGFFFGISAAFLPASGIITGICASNATVYYASTKKKFERECE